LLITNDDRNILPFKVMCGVNFLFLVCHIKSSLMAIHTVWTYFVASGS